MSKLAIRLSTLAICATALVAVPPVAPTKAEASSGHIKKHRKHWRSGFNHPRFIGGAQPAARPPVVSGDVCPGSGRSFECKIWPPPYADDPDRKTSKY